jgi:hypothetical protein
MSDNSNRQELDALFQDENYDIPPMPIDPTMYGNTDFNAQPGAFDPSGYGNFENHTQFDPSHEWNMATYDSNNNNMPQDNFNPGMYAYAGDAQATPTDLDILAPNNSALSVYYDNHGVWHSPTNFNLGRTPYMQGLTNHGVSKAYDNMPLASANPDMMSYSNYGVQHQLANFQDNTHVAHFDTDPGLNMQSAVPFQRALPNFDWRQMQETVMGAPSLPFPDNDWMDSQLGAQPQLNDR